MNKLKSFLFAFFTILIISALSMGIVALAQDAPTPSVTIVAPDESPADELPADESPGEGVENDGLLDSLFEAVMPYVLVAIPLITTLVSIVKHFIPDVSPQLVRLVLSALAYVVIVYGGLEVPFDSINALLLAVASIVGLDIGSAGVYSLSKRAETPLLGAPRDTVG